jgi:hypothetical protein
MIESIDALVQAFLKECKRNRVAVLVTYAFKAPGGGSPVRMATNTDEAGTAAVLNWMTKLGKEGIEAAAKVLAFIAAGEGKAPVPEGAPTFETADELWPLLSEPMRLAFTAQAQKVIDAAKAHQGKTLNIIRSEIDPS